MPDDSLSDVPDNALVALYGNGDRRAAETLARRLVPRILAFSDRYLGDRGEAEDVTQEVMLRLWQRAPEWREEGAKVSTWAYRVAANLCTDRLRRSGRLRPLDAARDPADERAQPDAAIANAERERALNAALAELPDRQRQAVVLRHIEGLSNPEIGRIMDIGVEAVESLTARGRRGLSDALQGRRMDLGYEDDR